MWILFSTSGGGEGARWCVSGLCQHAFMRLEEPADSGATKLGRFSAKPPLLLVDAGGGHLCAPRAVNASVAVSVTSR